jgi:hypothetical protein
VSWLVVSVYGYDEFRINRFSVTPAGLMYNDFDPPLAQSTQVAIGETSVEINGE